MTGGAAGGHGVSRASSSRMPQPGSVVLRGALKMLSQHCPDEFRNDRNARYTSRLPVSSSVRARQHCDDVVGLKVADLADHVRFSFAPDSRMEIAERASASFCRDSFLRSRQLLPPHRDVSMTQLSTLGLPASGTILPELEFRTTSTVARHFGLMNQNNAYRALRAASSYL